jgi:diadenosine tetraphosphate (Ap4A) HIT family hydrolase
VNPESILSGQKGFSYRLVMANKEEIMDSTTFQVYSGKHYVIEHCRDCPIPGYLIVRPVSKARNLEDLDAKALTALGRILARAVSVVREVVQPLKVYCVQFGEGDSHIHFHIFPRTKEMTEEYLRENPGKEDLINGPILFDWCRKRIKKPEDPKYLRVIIEKIRELIAPHPIPSGPAR